MSIKPEIEAGTDPLDTVKLLAALVLLLGGIGAFYWFASEPMYVRVGAILGGVVLAVLLSLTTVSGRSLWSFVDSSRVELRKMVWPTRQETVQTTLVLTVVVILLGLVMFAIDWMLAGAVEWLVGRGA